MQLADFDYDYPPELVAQHPLPQRDASRLLVLDRGTGASAYRQMTALPEYLRPGDLVVLNETKVLPLRVFGTREPAGRVELLLLRELETSADTTTWEALAAPRRRLRAGTRLRFEDGLTAVLLPRHDADGSVVVQFAVAAATLRALLSRIGIPPLPPYIKRPRGSADFADRERYQTIYATTPGSAAAPTAGLHFTPALLETCRAVGASIATVTLHVGIDTFQPIRTDTVEAHRMHGEAYAVPTTTWEAIAAAKSRGGRVFAVGTTTVRALESAHRNRHHTTTRLFIYPGFSFQVVDALLTNFHQPRSSLLVMVSAFAGRERVLASYREAIAQRYRLFSYGDAMLIC